MTESLAMRLAREAREAKHPTPEMVFHLRADLRHAQVKREELERRVEELEARSARLAAVEGDAASVRTMLERIVRASLKSATADTQRSIGEAHRDLAREGWTP